MTMANARVTEHVEDLLALSADLYWEQDAQLRFTYVTAAYLQRNGMSPADWIGKSAWDLPALNMTAGDWAVHRSRLERHEPFRDLEIERPATGGTRWVSVCGTPRFSQEGRFMGYRGLSRDISAQKRAETGARDDRARLGLVLDSLPAVVAHVDRDLRIVYANRAYADSIGCDPGTLPGLRLSDLIGEKHFALVEPHIRSALGGEPATHVCSHGRGTNLSEYEFRIVPDRGPDGGVRGAYMLGSDLSESARARRAAEEKEAELRTVLKTVPALIARMDCSGRVQYANESFAAHYGLTRDSIEGRNIRDLLGPAREADLDLLFARLHSGEVFSYKRAVKDAAGRPKTLQVQIVPESGRDGRVRSFFALATDVTEVERLNEEIQAREAEKSLLLDSLDISVHRADRTGLITYANRLFAERQGKRVEELVGSNLRDVIVPESLPWFRPLFEGALAGIPGEHTRWTDRPGRGRRFILSRVIPQFFGDQVIGVYAFGIDITELERLRAAVEEKEHEHRHLLDSIPAVVAHVTLDERFTYANDTYSAEYGLTSAEIVGRTVREVIGEDAYLRVAKPVARVHAGKVAHYDRHVTGPDGHSRSYSFSLVPDRDSSGDLIGTYVFGIDITPLYQAQALLTAKQFELSHVLESVPFGIARIDSGITYTFANTEMGRFLGRTPDEIVGLTMKDVLGEEVSAKVIPKFGLARGGDIVVYERGYATAAGEARWVEMTLRADPDPSTRGVFAVAVDVTDRHLHEERTESLVAQLKSANDELESFAYTVSHDLRAPLRAISGFASILNQDAGASLSSQARHYLERITSNAGRMSALIEGLLHFSQLARQELVRVHVSPETIVAEIIADHEQDLASRDVRLQVGALPGCSGDPILLKQVFANLIDNAFKYTAGRMPAEIEIGSAESPEGTVYFVRDNGAGFDPAYAGKMFGVFQRLHSDQEFAGSGIGLATVKRIVGRHGGRVWAESEVGRGACFSFTLGAN